MNASDTIDTPTSFRLGFTMLREALYFDSIIPFQEKERNPIITIKEGIDKKDNIYSSHWLSTAHYISIAKQNGEDTMINVKWIEIVLNNSITTPITIKIEDWTNDENEGFCRAIISRWTVTENFDIPRHNIQAPETIESTILTQQVLDMIIQLRGLRDPEVLAKKKKIHQKTLRALWL
jgi:hypothetical protein